MALSNWARSRNRHYRRRRLRRCRFYSRYGRTRRYYDEFEEDEEESESNDVSDHVMGEVYDESTTLSCWSDRNGQKVLLGAMPLGKAEIVSADSIDQWRANREEFEGYTGNAGMTLERWYHRAAIVVWPVRHHFRLLCDAGTNASIAGLNAMIQALRRTAKVDRELKHRDCIAFASAIIDSCLLTESNAENVAAKFLHRVGD